MSRVSGKPYFLYILWSLSSSSFYIGISDDVENRLRQHNFGVLKSWTSRHRPWELVHREAYPDYRSARLRENELKAQKGGSGFFEKTGLDPSLFKKGS
jgi:putative endonuclease